MVRYAATTLAMHPTGLFSASSSLCSAADDLRASGFAGLAGEVEVLIAILELEIMIGIQANRRGHPTSPDLAA